MAASHLPLPLVLLALWGASWVVTRSRVGALIRASTIFLFSVPWLVSGWSWTARVATWGQELVQCAGCTGFWIGTGWGAFSGAGVRESIVWGLAAAGVSTVLDRALLLMQATHEWIYSRASGGR